jgi:hypothetical protein
MAVLLAIPAQLSCPGRFEDKEERAKSKEQGAKRKEERGKGKEQGAKSRQQGVGLRLLTSPETPKPVACSLPLGR